MNTKNKIIELTKKHHSLQKMFINYFEKHNDSYEYIEDTYIKITKYKEIIRNYEIDVLSFETLELLNDEVTKAIQESQSITMAKKLLSKKSQNLLSKDAYYLFGVLLNNGISESQIREDFTQKIAAHSDLSSYDFKKLLRSYVENKTSNSIDKIKDKAKNYRTNILFDKNNVLILSVNDYRACKELGSPSWCISYSESTFLNYRDKNLNNCRSFGSVFKDENEMHNTIGNRFYFVYDFNYDIEDKERLLGLTVSPSGSAIYAHYMNDQSVESETINKYMKLLPAKDMALDFIWNMKKYVTQNPLEQLQVATTFNMNAAIKIVDNLKDSSITIDALSHIANPDEITNSIFTKIYEKLDLNKKYKFSGFFSDHSKKGVIKLITSKHFLKFEEEKILKILNSFDYISFGNIISIYSNNGNGNYTAKSRNQKFRSSVYRNLLHYIEKIKLVDCMYNTRILQNIATYNHNIVPFIISKIEHPEEIKELFKATNLASLVKVLSLGANPFLDLSNKIDEHKINISSLDIRKSLNMKSVVSASKHLDTKQMKLFFNCELLKPYFEYESWKGIKFYKNKYKLQSSIETISSDKELKSKIMTSDRSEVKITSHVISIKLLELYIKDSEFYSWFDEAPFAFKFDKEKLCDYLIKQDEKFLTTFFSSKMFNNIIGEKILFKLFQHVSWQKDKSEFLVKCLHGSKCKIEQPLFDFGFSFNSDSVMSYLKSKKADFSKLMQNSTVKEIKFLNSYLLEA